MGPTELLVANFTNEILRLSLVAFALVCVILAYYTLHLKRREDDSTHVTFEKLGFKIQLSKVGPFIALIIMAAASLCIMCFANFQRPLPTQPYAMTTSFSSPSSEASNLHISPPGVPTRPDEHRVGSFHGLGRAAAEAVDLKEGQRVTVAGKLRMIEHPARIVDGQIVPAWFEIHVTE